MADLHPEDGGAELIRAALAPDQGDSLNGAELNWRRYVLPAVVGMLLLAAWESAVRYKNIPPYMLPAPTAIIATLARDWQPLASAWLVTLATMMIALAAAVLVGVALAALFASSRALELSLLPYAVILQVTPLVAVAPFIVLWIGFERVWLTQVMCAWIVAFYPILSNTIVGLRSTDRGLADLFSLYRATRWQRLRLLMAPTALPFFLAGLKVSTNLALVGAVVAEFVVGIGVEQPGLASTIFAAQQRSDTPLMFAALALVSLTGVAAYLATHLLSYWSLQHWHESVTSPER